MCNGARLIDRERLRTNAIILGLWLACMVFAPVLFHAVNRGDSADRAAVIGISWAVVTALAIAALAFISRLWLGRHRPVFAGSLITAAVMLLWSGFILWVYVSERTSHCWECNPGEVENGSFVFGIFFIVTGVIALAFLGLIWLACILMIALRRPPEQLNAAAN